MYNALKRRGVETGHSYIPEPFRTSKSRSSLARHHHNVIFLDWVAKRHILKKAAKLEAESHRAALALPPLLCWIPKFPDSQPRRASNSNTRARITRVRLPDPMRMASTFSRRLRT